VFVLVTLVLMRAMRIVPVLALTAFTLAVFAFAVLIFFTALISVLTAAAFLMLVRKGSAGRE
jgi:hypothetical protein